MIVRVPDYITPILKVWQKLAPGLMDFLDSPLTIPAIAPRPLLIYNGK